jgi:hypothetical protein
MLLSRRKGYLQEHLRPHGYQSCCLWGFDANSHDLVAACNSRDGPKPQFDWHLHAVVVQIRLCGHPLLIASVQSKNGPPFVVYSHMQVFLGAAAIMSNGTVMGRAGNAGVAMMAHAHS